MDREQIEHRVRACLASSGEPVVCAYLFGSVARDEPRFEDVDIAVLHARPIPATLENPHSSLSRDIEKSLGKPVDLIDLDRAPPDLVHRILRDGRLIVDRDPARRIAFEVRSRNEYFDLEHVRNEYRRLGRAPR